MRLIDADAFIEENKEIIDCEIDHPKYQDTLRELIDQAPTVKTFTLADIEENYRKGLEKGLEERPHGEWMKEIIVEEPRKNKRAYARCTECGVYFNHYKFAVLHFDFCPKCGARMKEGEAE